MPAESRTLLASQASWTFRYFRSVTSCGAGSAGTSAGDSLANRPAVCGATTRVPASLAISVNDDASWASLSNSPSPIRAYSSARRRRSFPGSMVFTMCAIYARHKPAGKGGLWVLRIGRGTKHRVHREKMRARRIRWKWKRMRADRAQMPHPHKPRMGRPQTQRRPSRHCEMNGQHPCR